MSARTWFFFLLLVAAPVAAVSEEGAMCLVHGVVKDVCTRCNPKLIPVFKARKDWCDEHQFPESFCPQCRPERGGRPAGDVGSEKAPAEGLRVKLRSAETASLAGIEVERGKPVTDTPAVHAWVKLGHDPSRRAILNPRSAGVIRSLAAQPGDPVVAGQALATIESAMIGTDRSRLEASRTRLRIAMSNHQRLTELFDKGAGTRKDILGAEQEVASARAEVETAEASLSMSGDTGGARTELRAPISGVVTRREASLGQMVDSEHELFEIVDPSVVWATLQIAETDVTRVRTGMTVEIRIPSLENRTLRGELSSLGLEVDPRTRTVEGRVILPDPDGSLRANLQGEAKIDLASPRPALALPRSAIQRVEDVWLAFVRIAPDEFETRRVKLGDMNHSIVHVIEGIHADEEVVTTGSFLLKTETLKGSIGAGCCEAEKK